LFCCPGAAEEQRGRELYQNGRHGGSLATIENVWNSTTIPARRQNALPEPGDVLLRPPVGEEEFGYGAEQWVEDEIGVEGHERRVKVRTSSALIVHDVWAAMLSSRINMAPFKNRW
jgi:hypothetical protein